MPLIVPNFIMNRLKQVVRKHSEGVDYDKLPDLYKKQFGSNLNFAAYGYKSIEHFCVDLKCILSLHRLKDGNMKLFSKDAEGETSEIKLKGIETETEVTEDESLQLLYSGASHKDTDKTCSDSSEDALLNCHLENLANEVSSELNIVRQWVNVDVEIGGHINIIVTEVFDPSKFWIQLRQHTVQLDHLEDRMQVFYTKHKGMYYIPMYAITDRIYITCLFYGDYHRAKVVDSTDKKNGTIKVYFIDYGTVSTVEIKDIYYIINDFVLLPAQAIRARLYGVQPVTCDTPWTQTAVSRFVDMVSKKALVGQICEIDEKNMILDIVIADTSKKDFFINDVLVYEKLAIFIDEEGVVSKSYDYEPTISNIHLYPTHKELETDLAPSYDMMLQFETTSVSYDRLFPKYFRKIESSTKTESANDSWSESYVKEEDEGEREHLLSNFESSVEELESQTEEKQIEEKLCEETPMIPYNNCKPVCPQTVVPVLVNSAYYTAIDQIFVNSMAFEDSSDETFKQQDNTFYKILSYQKFFPVNSQYSGSLANISEFQNLLENGPNKIGAWEKPQITNVPNSSSDKGDVCDQSIYDGTFIQNNKNSSENLIDKSYADNISSKLVTLECIGGINVHILTLYDNEKFLMVKELSESLFGSLHIRVIRRRAAVSPYLIDIGDVLLDHNAELKNELISSNAISDEVPKIDIVCIQQLPDLVKALCVTSPQCNDFLRGLTDFVKSIE